MSTIFFYIFLQVRLDFSKFELDGPTDNTAVITFNRFKYIFFKILLINLCLLSSTYMGGGGHIEQCVY